MDPGVVGVYIRCRLAEKGGGRYIKAVVTNGQYEALVGNNPDLWEVLEERARVALSVPPGHACFLDRNFWEPKVSPEALFVKGIVEVDLSEDPPPPEVWLAMVL